MGDGLSIADGVWQSVSVFMASNYDLEPLCERIYDAAVNAEEWPSTLDEIATCAGCAWGALLTRRSDCWIGWRISPGSSAEVDAYLRSDSARQSVTTARLFAIGHPGFISDVDHFTEEERRVDPYFRWAQSRGFGHGAATGFQLNTGDLLVIQLMRAKGDPPLSAADLEGLDRLRPHLARAGMLAARWKMERLRAATDALAMVGLPAIVLTADCRALAANALTEELSSELVWCAGDGFALSDQAASAKLRRQVRACATSGSMHCAGSFPMWDDAGTSAMIVHVIPLKGHRRELFDGGLALVLFTKAGRSSSLNHELIREIFDLTPAEAKVAAQLAAGRSIEQIAGIHRVSVSTVRSQAKSILHKVGAHRQAELAARLGSIGVVRI